MTFSPEAKRKIILTNYSQARQQLELEKLEKISNDWQVPVVTFQSLEEGCGDILHLLIKNRDNHLEKCLFSARQSCLITVAAANILCSYLEGKEIKLAHELINNCQKMANREKYDLSSCPDFQVFSDISQFPHRLECIKLVLRGLSSAIK